ncbi:hypothetical protein ACO0RG_003074 [Hanseniaspora osmophila]
MRKVLIKLLFIELVTFTFGSCSSEFLVRLRNPLTLKSLIAEPAGENTSDLLSRNTDTNVASFHLNTLSTLIKQKEINITKKFSFGGFEAFNAELTLNVLNKLKENPFIAEVVHNDIFQAFDHEEDLETSGDTINDGMDNENKQVYKNGTGFWSKDMENEYQEGKSDGDDASLEFFLTQYNAPRHLARCSRREKLPKNSMVELDNGKMETHSFNYYFDPLYQGQSVNVYILDTGIQSAHPDFENRSFHGADFVKEGPGDLNGHGTHVAGIIGSKSFGVAKKVNLIEVKCLDRKGEGDLSSVIGAIQFAVEDMKQTGKPSVANLSLGAFRNPTLNEAVRAAVKSGLVMVVAAGNSNTNACLNSPLSEDAAITVGAIDDRTDTLAKFSNWGECVDIFASGVLVESLSITDSVKPVIFSGTSMATPSVTGLVAILLEKGFKPEHIKDQLLQISTKHFMKRRTFLLKPKTPNKLLFNGVEKEDDVFQSGSTSDEEENYFYDSFSANISANISHDMVTGEDQQQDGKRAMSIMNGVKNDIHMMAKRELWHEPSFEELQTSINF